MTTSHPQTFSLNQQCLPFQWILHLQITLSLRKFTTKKKKKLRQEPEKVDPTEVVPTIVPTNMLINVSKHVSETPERFSSNEIISAHPILIPKEIIDITFNKIVNESINMIIDQLDSTHLSIPLPNPLKDQLSTRYQASLSSTGVLDKSHSFTPFHNSSSQINTSIRHPSPFL
ncbi:hypothetical protein C1645_814166 [Glomus cerebriforme]|uniref:Uncharacterized protein n=1 Tax=Glomus cerebriforme TaxID=658196 RepID=A0A397TG88_9GLOM|nr:hypothetical protein C1645_814166 [Glomus cerebriforme]